MSLPEKEEGKEREEEEEGKKEQWRREDLFAALEETEILLLEPVKRVREAEGMWVLMDFVGRHWGDVITGIEAIVFASAHCLTFSYPGSFRATSASKWLRVEMECYGSSREIEILA